MKLSNETMKFLTAVEDFKKAEVAFDSAIERLSAAITNYVPYVAKYKVGELVVLKRGKAVISRIEGKLNHKRDSLISNYYGKQVLKDGKSLGKEKEIYSWDFKDSDPAALGPGT